MVAIANADILNNFPVLQLAAGALVIIVGVYLTIRAASDNKKTSHIAPAGHDPLGLTVFFNGIVATSATLISMVSTVRDTLMDIRVAISESNEKLENLRDSHSREMSHLRETVENLQRGDKASPRRSTPRE